MLTIKDLNTSKEMDRKEMSAVSGGMGEATPFAGFSLLSPINAPDFAQLAGETLSSTGPVSNSTFQDDRDIMVAGSGQNFNLGGNSNTTVQQVTSLGITALFNSQ